MTEEILHLTLGLWHPDCWTLKVTEQTNAGLLGYGVYTTVDDVAKGRFLAYGDSKADVDALVEATRESPLTAAVFEVEHSYEPYDDDSASPGNVTREIFVEYDPENSIDQAFVSRGFIYDGPVRIEDGREYWSVLAHYDRQEVQDHLATIAAEMDAEIEVLRIATSEKRRYTVSVGIEQLSTRQREVFELARDRNYYAWPREVTTRELAEELGISKTTFLEHLRRAEAKLLNAVE